MFEPNSFPNGNISEKIAKKKWKLTIKNELVAIIKALHERRKTFEARLKFEIEKLGKRRKKLTDDHSIYMKSH